MFLTRDLVYSCANSSPVAKFQLTWSPRGDDLRVGLVHSARTGEVVKFALVTRPFIAGVGVRLVVLYLAVRPDFGSLSAVARRYWHQLAPPVSQLTWSRTAVRILLATVVHPFGGKIPVLLEGHTDKNTVLCDDSVATQSVRFFLLKCTKFSV